MNPFEKHYAEDLEQVELHGVTFHVKLPGATNKRFQRAVLAQIVDQVDDSDELVTRNVDIEEMAEVQVAAFARTCIRQVDGWDEYSPEKLLAMPDACEDLWAAVIKLNSQREGEAGAAAKKSETTSDGLSCGPESASESSTPILKSAEA